MDSNEIFQLYRGALETNNILAQKSAIQLLKDIGRVQPEVLAKEYESLIKLFGATASQVSSEYYQQMRDLTYSSDGFNAEVVDQFAPDTFGEVNHVLNTAGTKERAAELFANQIISHIMFASDLTFEHNANRDKARKLFALVPHFGACSWCVMQGSRGFTFTSVNKASNVRHSHCRCTVAVAFNDDDMNIAGYSPQKLFDQYQKDTKFLQYIRSWDKYTRKSNKTQ